MHHLARHSVACFLTRGDLVMLLPLLLLVLLSLENLTDMHNDVSGVSSYTGNKGVMCSRGF